MIEYFKDPKTWTAIVSSIATIIALFLSIKNTRTSNKQNLFNRRLEKYMLINDIMHCVKTFDFENNVDILTFMPKDAFNVYTNFLSLNKMYKSVKNDDFFKMYPLKLEILNSVIQEMKLIWNPKEVELPIAFMSAYNEYLNALHLQDFMINCFFAEAKVDEFRNLSDERKKDLEKNAEQNELVEKIKRVKELYNRMVQENIMEKLSKTIKF